MNKSKALEILGIDDADEETVKKAYRGLALKYHPDKNPNVDSTAKFQEIHAAYVYLTGSSTDGFDYTSLLRAFLRTWLVGDGENDVLHEWLRRITTICEEKAILLLQNIDKHILKNIYELISKNSEILHISSNFIEKMRDVLKGKFENDERIILHPFLDDIENIYKLTIGEKVYLVPLWHHHLVYDADDGKEIYVDCYPLLPDPIWIDEYNNIHIEVKHEGMDIWKQNGITVDIGKRSLFIDKSEIRLTEYQVITCMGKGIPTTSFSYLNTDNNVDWCKDKSHVYIHLTIYFDQCIIERPSASLNEYI